MKRRTIFCQRGFSFVEVILVAVILSILGGAVFLTFSQGMRLWNYAQEDDRDVDMEVMLTKMQADMNNSINYRETPVTSSKDRFTFYAVSKARSLSGKDDYGGFWVPGRVSYSYDAEKKRILRRREAYQAVLEPPLEKDRAPEVVVAEGVKKLEFEYYYPIKDTNRFEWRYYWESECLPKAVRITLQFDDDSKGGFIQRAMSVPGWGCAV